MPAYAIVSYRQITDPEVLKTYGRMAGPTLKEFGAKPLVANTPGLAMEGPDAINVVVLEFADLDAARSWYASPEYQEAAALRQTGSKADVLIVDGIPAR